MLIMMLVVTSDSSQSKLLQGKIHCFNHSFNLYSDDSAASCVLQNMFENNM